MTDTIVTRSIKTALIFGITGFGFLALSQPPNAAWGLLIGTVSSALNLYLLSLVSQSVFAPLPEWNPGRKRAIFLYVALKFPLFYLFLAVLFHYLHFSINFFMIGFSIPLGVIVLKSVGQMLVERGFVDRGRKRWQVDRNR